MSERELKGEVDDALARNPSLEAWILVSTRNATETTQETLQLKSRSVGVPIIVIDWSKAAGSMPDLAALCAWAPDLVEAHHGKKAASAAKKLAALATPVVDRIRRELEPWNVGYKHLSRAAQQRLRRVWGNAGESRAALAQDAAGGASQALIERKQVQCLGP